MFYEKQLKTPAAIKRKITVNDFSRGTGDGSDEELKKFSEAEYVFNFDVSGGTLASGDGFKKFTRGGSFPDGVIPKKLFYYRRKNSPDGKNDDRLGAYCSDKKVYFLKLSAENPAFTALEGITFDKAPSAVCYNYNDEDVILLSTAEDGLYLINDSAVLKIEDAPEVTSACIHSERLFVTDKSDRTAVWFSDDFNPANWYVSLEEAGFIKMRDDRGDVLKVISFAGYVFAFRSYGISRITAYGKQENFTVDNVYFNPGLIYGSSVTDCGDRIIFLAESGLYEFDGFDAKKILDGYDDMLSCASTDSTGAFFNGKFYLLTDVKAENRVRKAVLTYNLKKKSAYIINGANVSDAVSVGGETNELFVIAGKNREIATLEANSGKFFGNPVKREWKSAESDFGLPQTEKLLYKISVAGGNVTEAFITADGKTERFVLKGNAPAFPFMKGKKFSVKISSKYCAGKIGGLTLCVSYKKENLW